MGARETVGHGNIFKNLHKRAANHPDFEGTITIHDAEREVAAWWKVSEQYKGSKFLSVRVGRLFVKGQPSIKPGEEREVFGEGVLYPNRKKKEGEDRMPDYRGTITIHGVKRLMAAWWKKDKNNDDFLSIAVGDVVEDRPDLPAHGG